MCYIHNACRKWKLYSPWFPSLKMWFLLCVSYTLAISIYWVVWKKKRKQTNKQEYNYGLFSNNIAWDTPPFTFLFLLSFTHRKHYFLWGRLSSSVHHCMSDCACINMCSSWINITIPPIVIRNLVKLVFMLVSSWN